MDRNVRAAEGVAAHPATRGALESQASTPSAPILHVIASSHGGGAVHVHTLTAELARRGTAVVVAMPLDGGHLDAENFTTAGVGFAPWHADPTLRAVPSLAAILRAHRPRLVH